MLWTSVIIFVTAYVLMVSEKLNRTVAAMLGVAAVVLFGAIPYESAMEYVDLDVVFLLIGMMIIVDIFSRTGLFEWVAIFIAQRAKGNPVIILVGLLTATALFSAFLDNVTTVVLIAPVTILIAQILELPVAPFLIFEAIFSNIGGTSTLVGDPPNILIGSKAQLTFNDFLANLGPVIVLSMLVIFAGILFFQHSKFRTTKALRRRIMRAVPGKAILDPWRLKRSLVVFFLILCGFVSSHWLGLEPGIIAITGSFIMVVVTRNDLRQSAEKVEWETILFLMGLFMLVGSLEYNGLFEVIAGVIFKFTQGHLFATAMIVLWTCAIVSAFVDNIPVVIAMIPLVHNLLEASAVDMGMDQTSEVFAQSVANPLWWSLALGACLGGNGTMFGAAANIVIAQVAKRNGIHLSFRSFLNYGVPVTFVTLFICSIYIYLRYFAFSPL